VTTWNSEVNNTTSPPSGVIWTIGSSSQTGKSSQSNVKPFKSLAQAVVNTHPYSKMVGIALLGAGIFAREGMNE
jgi:hypothetical protein